MWKWCLFLHQGTNRLSFILVQLLQAQINYFFFLVKAIPAKITELDNSCYSRGSHARAVTVLEHLVPRTKASTLIMALTLFLRKLKNCICIPAAALSGISASVRTA